MPYQLFERNNFFVNLLCATLFVLIFTIGIVATINPTIFFRLELSQPYIENYPLLEESPIEVNVVPQVESAVHTIELTPKGRSKIGQLLDLKDVTVAEAIRQRGGGQNQIKELQTGYGELTVGEIANMAAAGDKAAEKAIKMIKQASRKAQKYGGK